MKIILITPNFTRGAGLLGLDHYVHPSIGLGIMASILRAKGHNVIIKDPLVENLSMEDMIDYIMECKPDILGLTIVSMNYNNAKELAGRVKTKSRGIRIVVGGPHLYSDINKIMPNNECFNFACLGEGDWLIDKLIESNFSATKLGEIEGLVYRTDNEIKVNSIGICEDLDKLPFPAYSIYPRPLTYYKPAVYNYKRLPSVGIMTSRGCPSQCIFCQGAIFNKKIRMHSVDYVIEHIKFLISDFGIRDIVFYDDVFTIEKERVYQLCDLLLKEKIKISWSCFIRATNSIDEGMLRKMKEAGCWLVMPGIESGSPEILKLLKKGISLSQVERISRLTDKLGIQTRPSFMLGNPGETMQTLKKTFDFALSLPINHIAVSYFTPLPGTPIWNDITKYGDFDCNDADSIYFMSPKPSFTPRGMRSEKLASAMKELYFKFYFRPSTVFRHIKYLRDIDEFKKTFRGMIIFCRLAIDIFASKLKIKSV